MFFMQSGEHIHILWVNFLKRIVRVQGSLSFFRLQSVNHLELLGYVVMGHRHLFNTSQMLVTDHDQNQNHTHVEQPLLHSGRANSSGNVCFVLPTENLSIGRVNFAPHWNSTLRSYEYSSSSVSMALPHYPMATSGPTYDPLLHPSAAESFCPVPQNFTDSPSSSSYYGNIIHGAEGNIDSSTMANARGPCKRKNPAIPAVCDRGSTHRHYNAGSSSDLSISFGLQPQKPISDSQSIPLDPMGISPGYRGNNLSIAEGSQRNVRIRSTLDLEVGLARTHLSNNPYGHLHSTSHPIDHSGTLDVAGQSVTATTHEWNHIFVSPAPPGRILDSDISGLSHGMDQLVVGSNNTDSSMEFSRYHHNFIPSGSSVVPPQNLRGPTVPVEMGGRSSFAQRAIPAYGATSSHPCLRDVANSSEDGLQSMQEAYSSRHSRPVSTIGWHGSDRSERLRLSYERLHSLSDETVSHGRLASEGVMMVDHSASYGSRNLLDRHRDMRLDIDNMSYEELLALGERIGNVSTGLSEHLISKCLVQTLYFTNQIQEQGTCAICLEEYKNMEKVGTLIKCGHDYHVGCIKKWLLMKNLCPICKASAMEDKII